MIIVFALQTGYGYAEEIHTYGPYGGIQILLLLRGGHMVILDMLLRKRRRLRPAGQKHKSSGPPHLGSSFKKRWCGRKICINPHRSRGEVVAALPF